MKKRNFITGLTAILLVGTLFTSCEKEELTPPKVTCGQIRELYQENGYNYVEVRSDVTGDNFTVALDSAEWAGLQIHEEECFDFENQSLIK